MTEPKYPAGPWHGAVLSAAGVQVPDLFSLRSGDRTPGNRVELPLSRSDGGLGRGSSLRGFLGMEPRLLELEKHLDKGCIVQLWVVLCGAGSCTQ